MAIVNSQLAQLSARAAVARAGTARSNVAPNSRTLRADGTGQIIWQRPVARNGNPDSTASSWTTQRD